MAWWKRLVNQALDCLDAIQGRRRRVARAQLQERLSEFPSDLWRVILPGLASADRLALLRTCTAGRDAVIRCAPRSTITFSLAMTEAELQQRSSSLVSVMSRLRPEGTLSVQLELGGDAQGDKRLSDRASWLLRCCAADAGPNRTWEVKLKGLHLGSQWVPDYLAVCPALSSLHLVSCFVSQAAPESHPAGGVVVHAALQRLTIDGGFRSTAKLSAQQNADILRQQLPRLPALHSMVIKVHRNAGRLCMPHYIGAMGPQLHQLHIVQTAGGSPALPPSLRAHAASLTHLTRLHLDSPHVLQHAEMRLLLLLPAVTHLTIPAPLLQARHSLAHLPCAWRQLRIIVGNYNLDLRSFLRLPLSRLQQPVQLLAAEGSGIIHVWLQGGSAAELQALVGHMQPCGGFTWPQQVLLVEGAPTDRRQATSWLMAALPLLPRNLTQLELCDIEFNQALLDALVEHCPCLWALCLYDCHLHPAACGQLLARMPGLYELMFTRSGSSASNPGVHTADMQRLNHSAVAVCRTSTRPLNAYLYSSGFWRNRWQRALAAAMRAAGTRGVRVRFLMLEDLDGVVRIYVRQGWRT